MQSQGKILRVLRVLSQLLLPTLNFESEVSSRLGSFQVQLGFVPKLTWIEPFLTWIEPFSTWIEPFSTWIEPFSTWIVPSSEFNCGSNKVLKSVDPC